MTTARIRSIGALIAVAACAAVFAAPSADARPGPRVTVMTRNLYLGADLIPAASAPDQARLRAAATAIVQHVQATDFPARAKLLAAEIASAHPDLVALQEVATWRRTPAGAASGSPATVTMYDWLRSLQSELRARHARYRAVAVEHEFDFQLPTDLGYDARLTLRDVVLARRSVKVRAARSAAFRHILNIPTQAGPAAIHRGYNRLDASVRGVRFRFVNTHLEAYSATIRAQQAKELVAGPLKSRRPVILAGDLNSDRVPAQPGDTAAYRVIAHAGFKDRASRRPSCCHEDDLKSGGFDHIVDHIMSKPSLPATRRRVTGNGPRTPAGLFPSDHGGLVVTLRLPRR
jgi:endonuclease/exonuclease/phosphatase family metal-dependent hydrolase